MRNRAERRLAAVLALFLGAWSVPAQAAHEIRVLALFSGKALLQIDGQRRLLADGATSPEGVHLLSASSRGAEVEVDGNVRTLALGASGLLGSEPAEHREFRVRRAANGTYVAPCLINGAALRCMFDTGATQVSISGDTARALGIPYRSIGRPARVMTASGVSSAWALTLESVQFGELRLSSVDALVIDGRHPAQPLLGSSFINRLHLRTEGEVLILQQGEP